MKNSQSTDGERIDLLSSGGGGRWAFLLPIVFEMSVKLCSGQPVNSQDSVGVL